MADSKNTAAASSGAQKQGGDTATMMAFAAVFIILLVILYALVVVYPNYNAPHTSTVSTITVPSTTIHVPSPQPVSNSIFNNTGSAAPPPGPT